MSGKLRPRNGQLHQRPKRLRLRPHTHIHPRTSHRPPFTRIRSRRTPRRQPIVLPDRMLQPGTRLRPAGHGSAGLPLRTIRHRQRILRHHTRPTPRPAVYLRQPRRHVGHPRPCQPRHRHDTIQLLIPLPSILSSLLTLSSLSPHSLLPVTPTITIGPPPLTAPGS